MRLGYGSSRRRTISRAVSIVKRGIDDSGGVGEVILGN